MQILNDLDRLKREIDQALNSGANPIAAFDADGTLWDTDMGENFFKYIIDKKLVELPKNPWEHYLHLRNGSNPPDGYLWLAQLLKGVPLKEVQTWSLECTKSLPELPIFQQQKELISYLKSQNVEVFVVTASVKWAVEAPAEAYGINHDHVIGVTTKTQDNIITDIQDGPVTWREGKVKGLHLHTNNKAPMLAAGNTTGDIYLLEDASHIKIAVQTVSPGHMIYNSEETLYNKAIEKGWFTHDFRK